MQMPMATAAAPRFQLACTGHRIENRGAFLTNTAEDCRQGAWMEEGVVK